MRSKTEEIEVLSSILVWDSFIHLFIQQSAAAEHICKGLTLHLTAVCWFAGENFSWEEQYILFHQVAVAMI